MSKTLQLKELYTEFRNPDTIKSYASLIKQEAKKLERDVSIMEVCGGHTHTIMKYGLLQLLPKNVHFIHGPGCPVCIMPKERVDHAIALSKQPDVILVTLGDMIKVPGSEASLQDARAKGADVRFVYSPTDCLKIAEQNPDKTVIFFAIGFETTTPMTSALINQVINKNIKNILFHINHVTVPEPMRVLLDDDENKIDAFIGPAHVSVITGSKIYDEFPRDYKKPVVVSGFEPVDVIHSVLMILKQFNENRCEVEVEYSRSVSHDGNVVAQKLNDMFFERRDTFRWRGVGEIPKSALKLKDEYSYLDAEVTYAEILPNEKIDDHKLCICGDILKGKANPIECKVFGNACKPSSPLGSCMVSSEGACAAYYKYGGIL
ncbi:MAG: hydrogenase formation protein HypD [Sulfurimonas sp.]|uniref:hydrogenase formation protein HypD n=1 Tax=Sulfurimonas sp. TaxID=2022749 RepID=UPI002626F61A|nr:hydrogenase formation protein HypD [Sulfurimonas sp.]MCW8894346.1 hydrogenase formation protein HypD [Sulfurimonas sp.]MCW8954249.1 hydrogenase formation protein HypD [Sulfurimonas sp.]MCW9066831.1 hydrogenase formation protein HypD [Sulfurimonas sp.]